MEVFKIKKSNIFISDLVNKYVHVDYYPDNIGIQNTFMLGAEISFKDKTIEQAIADYEDTARSELFIHIDKTFPGMFKL